MNSNQRNEKTTKINMLKTLRKIVIARSFLIINRGRYAVYALPANVTLEPIMISL